MRILTVMNVPYTRASGGANRSNRSLLEGLAGRGHEVTVVTPALASPSPITYDEWRAELGASGVQIEFGADADRFRLRGVDVVAVRDPRRMRREFVGLATQLAPDWILVASEDPSQSLLSAALEIGHDNVVYLALTPQLFPFGPESLHPGRERTELVRRCALVCCLGRITADYIHEHSDIEAHVYHPPHFGPGPFPRFENFRRGAVLLMNACQVKGLSIFLGLARAFPDVSFAALPGYGTTTADRRAIEGCPNVSVWPNSEKIHDILRETSILLMPSLWMESFGLAAVDAMLCGIPVLASDHGALPEAKLGTDYLLPVRPITVYREELDENLLPVPIVPEQDLSPWKEALGGLLNVGSLYRKQSAAAREAATQFVAGLSVESFERLLLEKPGASPPGTVPRAPRTRNDGTELTPEQKSLLIMRLRQKNARATGAGRVSAGIPAASRDSDLPLSFAQQRLFFLEQLNPGVPTYNCPSAVRLHGPLDRDALRRAFDSLVRRHESLRTTFRVRGGQPAQVVAPAAGADLRIVDLGAFPHPEKESQLRDLLGAEASRPFDMAHGPLFRPTLFAMTPEDHVLLLDLHHIITDGWSDAILRHELATLYDAFSRSGQDPLPVARLQYADYAIWQRQALSGEAIQTHLDAWTSALSGAPGMLDLPTDRPRPNVQSQRGASLPFRIPSPLTIELQQLARRHDVTLFMVLLAAFDVLLHRLSGQDDLVVGTTVANRAVPGADSIVGFFVNTLPVRVRLSGNPTFVELLGRVRESTLESFDHQELPFDHLVRVIAPERSRDHAPVFQVLFQLHNEAGADLKLRGLQAEPLHVHSGTSKFDLNLELTQTIDGLAGSLEYDTALFDAETVDVLLASWRALLAEVVCRPEDRIGILSLIDRSLRERLDSVQPAEQPYGATSVIDLFRDQVARDPAGSAVFFDGRTLSYGELDRGSNQVARHLIRSGVGVEDAVGICVERSMEMVVGVLGVLKAGAAYVPLDPAYPADRRDFMIRETAAKLILTQRKLAPHFAHCETPLVLLDGEHPGIRQEDAPDPRITFPADSLAYVMYTSGSTGRPKGVQLSHRALLNLILWHLEKFPGPAKMLQFASLSFDASFHEIFATLAGGGLLYLLTEAERRELPGLPAFIREHGIEKVILPVVMLNYLSEHLALPPGGATALRDVICTGEQLKVTPAVRRFFAERPGLKLHNDYGPTESHVVSSCCVSDRGDFGYPSPPIGLPIRNSRMYILDQHLNPLPPGFPGDLYLAGDCLARGYHDAPEMTADQFVPDPFSRRPGQRMYRTGDVARLRHDGAFEYLGRRDHQVKLRGLRVEPGEIEAALREQPGVQDCLVLCREDQPGDKRLVAYVVAKDGEAPSMTSLRKSLSGRLPEFMIPSSFIPLPRFPVTPNGKIDRGALPRPQDCQPDALPSRRKPQTDLERRLARIWADLLGRPEVDLDENFFALGGHSILMLQIVSRIEDEFGARIPVQSFFDGPTVGEQVLVLTAKIADDQGAGSLESLLDEVEELDPASVELLLREGAAEMRQP
jgi:amino acid adenylation domain-containing protein